MNVCPLVGFSHGQVPSLHRRSQLSHRRTNGVAKHGFYTACFLEAPNPQAAEEAAIAQLRARDSLHDMVLNRDDDPPMMHVDEIDEIEAFEGTRSPGDQGLIWYNESDTAEAD